MWEVFLAVVDQHLQLGITVTIVADRLLKIC
jgi:hypothetical protein